jgi:hypothetical protein
VSVFSSGTFIRMLSGIAYGLALTGCGPSSVRTAEDARGNVAARSPIPVIAGTVFRDHATDTPVELGTVLGRDGAVVLVLDQRACESCLAIDVEIRALRSRNPRQPVLVLTDSVNAGSVSQYLASMKSPGRLLVVSSADMAMLTMGLEGALTAHLVDGAGRVLFSQTRVPGARQELLVEDLRALEALLSPTPTG